ncbi:MAG: fibronectin type III domain-containing protein [Firmicutes bacterium]|nr:fibronectin type III domain-containing protein [Bacillota bacterium]
MVRIVGIKIIRIIGNRNLRGLLAALLAASVILLPFSQFLRYSTVFAQTIPMQPAPEKLRVEAIYNTPPDVQPPIGYNEFDGYYADLKWDPLKNPEPNIAQSKYMNFYLQEVAKPYKPTIPIVLKEANIPANPGSATTLRMKGLSSGTVYYTYATAWYTYVQNETSLKSPESVPSNMVKFLTDIQLEAYSYGIRQIKIIWDDVWESGRRIDYKLYISEDRSFTNTPPIYIRQFDIGPGRPVSVNENTGKLEYIYTVRDPGRVYYIKIMPDITDTELKHSKESNVVAVSSFILAKTTKMASTETGTIWKIEWSPVVTGLNTGDVKITYHIYRGVLDSNDIPQYVAAVDDTIFITTLLPEDENNYYFIIRAFVTRQGIDVYPGIKIESDKIIIRETEVPYIPAAPLLVDKFEDRDGRTIISYIEELKPDLATILWRVPETGKGTVDIDISYDIWLISDPNMIDSPPESTKIASSIKMTDANKVMDGSKLVGYKYNISNLTPNTIYYFKITAKKSFIDYEGERLEEITLSSEPVVKVIITPPEDIAYLPLVPGRPPLKLKKHPGQPDKYMITETTAVIQLKDKWYEEYNHSTGKWEYRAPEELGEEIIDQLEKGTGSNDYRIVQYDSGISLDVGCVEHKEGMSYSDIAKIPADKVKGFPAAPNDPYEDPLLNPDKKKHNIDIILTDLKPNTSYIVWVRAVRTAYALVSGPSDPIIITTTPELVVPVEKPTVPSFNYYHAGDNFVDLGWDFRAGYYYNIKYGTEDNINSAKGSAEVKPEDLFYAAYYRIKGLEQEKVYYFWIQAVAVGADGQKVPSDWSDSLVVKTLPYIPPETPRGFGVKNTKDAVTKDSITYEWIMEDGIEYIIEIAGDIDYNGSIEYKAGKVSEFTVEGLRSNYRYYARLYAYDPEKDLRSLPTQSVVCRTRRSLLDYDSDEYAEDVIKGDYIVKEYIIKDNTWNIRIEGINADMFIENMMNDNVVDYILDVTDTPYGTKHIVISISGRVFDAMYQLKENLIILNPVNQIVMRPGVFAGTNIKQFYNSNYEITITLKDEINGAIPESKLGGIKLKTDVTGLKIRIRNGQLFNPIYRLGNPLQIIYSYSGQEWNIPGVTTGLIYDMVLPGWEKTDTISEFDTDLDKGRLIFDMPVTGGMAVGDYTKDKYDDISASRYRTAINNVASAHELKSIKGNLFYIGKDLSVADAVKFILDVMDYDYGNNFLNAALRAGIISKTDLDMPEKGCTREKALFMAARLYELKTGEKAKPRENGPYPFKDMDKISPHFLDKVKFAIENGFMSYRISDMLEPDSVIMRGEFMGILEKVLEAAGELN